jgi:hypothetical protein
MPLRLFDRLSDLFWGRPTTGKSTARTRKPVSALTASTASQRSRSRQAPPARFATPQRRVKTGYAPLTPIDTPVGAKRRRSQESEEGQRKRYKSALLETFDEEDEGVEDTTLLEDLTRETERDGPEADAEALFSETDEYDTGDEDEDEGAWYEHVDHQSTINVARPARLNAATLAAVAAAAEQEDLDKEAYDYTVYDPTIRHVKPSRPLQLRPRKYHQPRRLPTQSSSPNPKILVNGAEDNVVYDRNNNTRQIYGNGDEDIIVFADTDGSDDENDHLKPDNHDNSSIHTSHQKSSSVFESFFEEAQDDQNDTILLDTRARVGSLEDERVSIAQLLAKGWPLKTTWLIQRIHQRGREPVFANHWRLDFPMMPEGMFLSPHHPHPGYIHALRRKNQFHAKRAFDRLLQLGPRVRDKILVGKAPETLIVNTIKDYLKWAHWDSGNVFADTYPFIEILAGTKEEDVQTMQDELFLRLQRLHARWTAAAAAASSSSSSSAPVPTDAMDAATAPPLYGILISHTLIGVLCYIPPRSSHKEGQEKEEAEEAEEVSSGYFRTVGLFDFSVVGYDVWTCLALALLVVHVRDLGVERGCCGGGGGGRKGNRKGVGGGRVVVTVGDDPDA